MHFRFLNDFSSTIVTQLGSQRTNLKRIQYLFNVQKRHEGRYKCKVKTLRDEASAEVPLRVIVNAPVITKFSEHQKVFSGTSLELECQATGIPSPETSWTFNKTSTSITGENYHIKSAMMTDSGFYTCTSKVGLDTLFLVPKINLLCLEFYWRDKTDNPGLCGYSSKVG